jgi:hypothetical protein
MRKALLWIGVLFCGLGVAVLAASAVLGFMGLATSYNLGDPAKFQFILVPFWLIGIAIAAGGALCLIGWRWLRTDAG